MFKVIRNFKQKAVFLDRDGTICEEANYLSRPEDLHIFPFAAQAINILREKGFLIILITNQSGIGRGFFDEKTLEKIHEKLIAELAEQNAELDAIYFCPHISDDNCDCRKPNTQMILQAAEKFGINLEKSWMIGDKIIDVQTGINAGTKTALVLTGYGQKERATAENKADLISKDLLEIAGKIGVQ